MMRCSELAVVNFTDLIFSEIEALVLVPRLEHAERVIRKEQIMTRFEALFKFIQLRKKFK